MISYEILAILLSAVHIIQLHTPHSSSRLRALEIKKILSFVLLTGRDFYRIILWRESWVFSI